MKVTVTLNKLNSGRMELACVRATNEYGGIGTGYSLAPFAPGAETEVKKVLSGLGVDENTIADRLSLLSAVGPKELLTVAVMDIPRDILRSNGFVAV